MFEDQLLTIMSSQIHCAFHLHSFVDERQKSERGDYQYNILARRLERDIHWV